MRNIFLLFIFFIQNLGKSQTVYDTVKLNVKTLPEKPSEIYTGNDFNYREADQGWITELVNRIIIKIIKFLNELFNFNIKSEGISSREALWGALLFIVLVLIIIGIFFLVKMKKNLEREEKIILSVEEVEKNIHEVDFEQLIQTALSENNYKLVIRFYYLRILKTLSDKNVVEYAFQKTNHEYLYEIQDKMMKEEFKEAVNLFDYSWYGEYPVGEKEVQQVENIFFRIQKLINH